MFYLSKFAAESGWFCNNLLTNDPKQKQTFIKQYYYENRKIISLRDCIGSSACRM